MALSATIDVSDTEVVVGSSITYEITFSTDATVPAGGSVQFGAVSGLAVAGSGWAGWEWRHPAFGGGTTWNASGSSVSPNLGTGTWDPPGTIGLRGTVVIGTTPGDYEFRAAYLLGGTPVTLATVTITVLAEIVLEPPVASFTVTPASGEAPLTVEVDGSASDDPDGTIVSWAWDFGDGDTATGATATHTYTSPGNYTITLTVTDNDDATDTATATVQAGSIPTRPIPSARFREALRYSHRATSRLVLQTADCRRWNLPVLDGSLTIDGTRPIRRSLDAEIGVDAIGTLSRDALEAITVQSGEVLVYSGIMFEDDTTEELLIGRLRVDDLTRSPTSTGQLVAYDYAKLLDDHPIDPATAALIPPGTDWRTAVRTLVEDTISWLPCGITDMLVISPDVPGWPLPSNTSYQDENRLALIGRWATALGCEFYNLPDGRFHLAPAAVTGAPVWSADVGTPGSLIDHQSHLSRAEQYNGVLVNFSVPDGDVVAIRAFVYDDDETSPTYWFGPFGKRVKVIDDLPAADAVQAERIAREELARYTGATRSLTLTTLRNPSLVPGDTIRVVEESIGGEAHLIDSVTHHLAKASLDLETRLVRS